ncbi:MAG: response regulator [Deltaproteobacteria bacterium]|nr:response regulator [Deltaproteobacteria bacterium]
MKRVLYVDDSSSMRNFVSLALSERFDVETACDGLEGLTKFKEKKADLLLVDIHMPHMDGISLIKEVRKLPHGRFVPILVLTTVSDTAMKMEGKAAGATGWLVKPFSEEKLLQTITKVMPQ